MFEIEIMILLYQYHSYIFMPDSIMKRAIILPAYDEHEIYNETKNLGRTFKQFEQTWNSLI